MSTDTHAHNDLPDCCTPAPDGRVRHPRRAIGERVNTKQGTGTVVDGSVWWVNVAEGHDPGDRIVSMDADGARLCFEAYLLHDAPIDYVTDRNGDTLTAHDEVTAPNGDTVHVTGVVPPHGDAPAIIRGRVTGGAYHGLAVALRAATVVRTGASWAPVPVLTGSPAWAAQHERMATPSAYERIMSAIVNAGIGTIHATVGAGVR